MNSPPPGTELADIGRFRSKPASRRKREHNISESERVLSIAAGIGLDAAGLGCRGVKRLALFAAGGALAWRGYTGHCSCYHALGINTAKRKPSTAVPAGLGCKFEKTIVVARRPAVLYRFWRHVENLPQVMRHLKSVNQIDEQRSHWSARGALGKDVEWDAEIINERENRMIAWGSLPDGDVETAGSVHFEPLPRDQGTQVIVSMKYNPPAGKIGATIASLMGEGLADKLEEDLQTFKDVMETGMPAAPASV
ncbi:MAG TPA: SRPBCC family protein [Lacipirellulaceae bacterium]|nr:SRPBCC family protein [Lacipirellulaceae bacterium]